MYLFIFVVPLIKSTVLFIKSTVPLIRSTKCDNLCAKTPVTKPVLTFDQKEKNHVKMIPEKNVLFEY